MCGLLIAIVILDCLPVSPAEENGPAQFWAFEASAFEDYGTAIAVPTISNASEAFHIAFEMEEEL
jgi:hypothetical protein